MVRLVTKQKETTMTDQQRLILRNMEPGQHMRRHSISDVDYACCSNCMFWSCDPDWEHEAVLEDASGECLRYPPANQAAASRSPCESGAPVTEGIWWCGEWRYRAIGPYLSLVTPNVQMDSRVEP